jgi:dipeptidyl aminopeptidase/acylaminoacyl peptidase
VARGAIDGARIAIRGGSAGAYTILMSVTFTDNDDPVR